jgi:hypothetical protein
MLRHQRLPTGYLIKPDIFQRGLWKRTAISQQIMSPEALLIIACCACGIARGADAPQRITIDFARPIGKLKPLNGVNHGPYYNGENAKLDRYHAEAGFTYTRLHDVHWPCPDCVDVSTIFPIFDADADDSKYYVFAKTDAYLAAILKNKSQIVYRLGEDIEPWTHYHNKPPDGHLAGGFVEGHAAKAEGGVGATLRYATA